MNRHQRSSFKPRLEVLEGRCTPSVSPASLTLFQSPGSPAVSAASPLDQHQVQVNDNLTAVPGSAAGAFSHMGYAAALEHSSVDSQARGTFLNTGGHTNNGIQPLDSPNGDYWAPFKLIGGGPVPDGLPLVTGKTVPHYAIGVATGLDIYTSKGTFDLGSLQISSTGQVSGTFQGSYVFVGSNGSRLACNYGVGDTGTFTGQLSADGKTVTNLTFDAVFTPDPADSTGRFANVVGGDFTMIAHANSVSLVSNTPGYTAPFFYTWTGDGSLEFSH